MDGEMEREPNGLVGEDEGQKSQNGGVRKESGERTS